jgi:hypothetical protein
MKLSRSIRTTRRFRSRKRGQHRQQRPLGAVALPRGAAIADCRPDLDIIDGLARAIKRAYQKAAPYWDPSVALMPVTATAGDVAAGARRGG